MTDGPNDQSLPVFAYHPDPLGTGSVEKSDNTCLVCDRARGYVYTGATYAVEELVESLCPWCIADGGAATKYNATFSDEWSVPAGIPAEVVDTISKRTPGFESWQGSHWLYHCRDGGAFLVGWDELQAHPDALAMLRHENDEYGWSPEQVDGYLHALAEDGEATAYLFRCRHCGVHLAYSDMS